MTDLKLRMIDVSKLEPGGVYALKLNCQLRPEELVALKEFVQEVRDELDIHLLVLSQQIDMVHLPAKPQTRLH